MPTATRWRPACASSTRPATTSWCCSATSSATAPIRPGWSTSRARRRRAARSWSAATTTRRSPPSPASACTRPHAAASTGPATDSTTTSARGCATCRSRCATRTDCTCTPTRTRRPAGATSIRGWRPPTAWPRPMPGSPAAGTSTRRRCTTRIPARPPASLRSPASRCRSPAAVAGWRSRAPADNRATATPPPPAPCWIPARAA